MTAVKTPEPRIESMPDALLKDPLDYFFADHFRQRIVCRLVDELSGSPEPDLDLAREVVLFLRRDLGLHVQDEEEDLFPLLRRRCEPEDHIGDVLDGLAADHAVDNRLAAQLVRGLEDVIARGNTESFDTKLTAALAAFSKGQRRHLAIENAIVLPLARARLTRRDLTLLTKRMRARRSAGRT